MLKIKLKLSIATAIDTKSYTYVDVKKKTT